MNAMSAINFTDKVFPNLVHVKQWVKSKQVDSTKKREITRKFSLEGIYTFGKTLSNDKQLETHIASILHLNQHINIDYISNVRSNPSLGWLTHTSICSGKTPTTKNLKILIDTPLLDPALWNIFWFVNYTHPSTLTTQHLIIQVL